MGRRDSSTSTSNSTTVINSTFYDNGGYRGGAVFFAGGTVKLHHVTIVNNSARSTEPVNQGGGVLNNATGTRDKEQPNAGNTGWDCRQNEAIGGMDTNLVRTGNCGTPASSDDPLLPASPTEPTDLSDPPAYFRRHRTARP